MNLVMLIKTFDIKVKIHISEMQNSSKQLKSININFIHLLLDLKYLYMIFLFFKIFLLLKILNFL